MWQIRGNAIQISILDIKSLTDIGDKTVLVK